MTLLRKIHSSEKLKEECVWRIGLKMQSVVDSFSVAVIEALNSVNLEVLHILIYIFM